MCGGYKRRERERERWRGPVSRDRGERDSLTLAPGGRERERERERTEETLSLCLTMLSPPCSSITHHINVLVAGGGEARGDHGIGHLHEQSLAAEKQRSADQSALSCAGKEHGKEKCPKIYV